MILMKKRYLAKPVADQVYCKLTPFQEAAEGEEEEDDDDLATAFEILDLARVCYLKRLENLDTEETETGKGKEVAEGDSPTVRHVKERLADTHDALSEISLENGRYVQALRILPFLP